MIEDLATCHPRTVRPLGLSLALLVVACGSAPAGDVSDGGDGSAWRSEAPVPAPLQELAIAVLGGRIVIAGGFEDGVIVPTVRAYEPASGGWSELPPLPGPRHHLMLAVHGRDLYAFGGMATLAFETVSTAWVLQDRASDWEAIAPLPDARAAGVAGTIGDAIYIAGGQGARGELVAPVYVYDVAADVWTSRAPLPTPREHTAGFVHDAELWIVAGRMSSLTTNLDAVEIYDAITDTWRAGAAIPSPRGGHGCALLDDVAYCVGGEDPRQALDSVEALDLVTGTWRALEAVPTPRHGHGVAAVGGRVYVVGGADRPIFAAVDVVESFAP